MANARNFDKEFETIREECRSNGVKPKLLLHCCCAPCSSYCLTQLNGYFDVTCFFYNPNITDEKEYYHRLEELKRFIVVAGYNGIKVIDGGYSPLDFFEAVKGNENLPEGCARCFICYRLRLEKTLLMCEKGGFDYFATTLTVSPHKRADVLNEIGEEIEKNSGVKYLPSDFKKRGGYLKSIELSKEYDLYRQNFCGCVFSEKQAREEKRII